MEITAKAKFLRIAPDKIRILSPLIKGKKLDHSLAQLQFCGKAAAKPLILVLKQAKNQATQANDKDIEGELIVKSVQVDEGPKLKRRRILHRGRATTILKRGSHIKIVVTSNLDPKSQTTNFKLKNKQKSLEIGKSDLKNKATERSM